MEMFPSVGRSQIESTVAEESSMKSAIESLLKPKDLPCLLMEQQARVMDMNNFTDLEMARACIANKAKTFYKACLHQSSQLTKGLTIRFSGELGIDAGALKIDFFLSYFRVLKEELFEGGSDHRLVPKNYWGCDTEFEMAGAAVAHSLLLGGPGFSVLHPAVYAHLALCSIDPENVIDLPCADDIPLNAATYDTKEFIDKVW